MRKGFNLIDTLLILSCVICNIAQIPVFMGNPLISGAYTISWVVLAIVIFNNLNFQYLGLPIYFAIFCLFGSFLGKNYLSSGMFRPVMLSTFILVVGIWLGLRSPIETLIKASYAFVISALLVAVFIYFSVFRGVDWAGSGAYLYTSKNSAGQIFLVAIILVAYFIYQEHKFFSIVAMLFLASLIISMKSRATIVTMFILILYYIFFVERRLNYRIFGIIFLVAAGIYIWINPSMHELVINQILLNNKETTDITGITSNRDLMINTFINEFPQYMLAGTGGSYLESMPLAVLLSYGVIGGIPLLLYATMPLRTALKNRKFDRDNILCKLVIVLSVVMLINGIFEEQSPFGPGVKCYFLWLVFGFYIGDIESMIYIRSDVE